MHHFTKENKKLLSMFSLIVGQSGILEVWPLPVLKGVYWI
jgi:hypothetical protein